MKNNPALRMGLRILLLGATGSAMTYVHDWLARTGYFGDRLPRAGEHFMEPFYSDGLVWGARHYWYNWTMGILFLLSVAVFIVATMQDIEGHDKPQR